MNYKLHLPKIKHKIFFDEKSASTIARYTILLKCVYTTTVKVKALFHS